MVCPKVVLLGTARQKQPISTALPLRWRCTYFMTSRARGNGQSRAPVLSGMFLLATIAALVVVLAPYLEGRKSWFACTPVWITLAQKGTAHGVQGH